MLEEVDAIETQLIKVDDAGGGGERLDRKVSRFYAEHGLTDGIEKTMTQRCSKMRS